MPKCFRCGIDTPLALRRPGPISGIPERQRGYLPYCLDHESEAFARRDAAINVTRNDDPHAGATPAQPKPARRGKIHPPAHDPEQGQLI